ncbi:DUF333 domain-containing protein [Cedecea davisae]|uniref:putative hemolysin n=1 Tax=Cedecea davisae TaxID=158484 RepID=UPI00376F034F
MKFSLLVIATLLLSACTSEHEVLTNVPVNMANPASVYCHNKGGKLSIVKGSKGNVGYCTLPSGELIEEWALYHRDHEKG